MHVAERIQDDTLVLMISGRVTFYSRKVFQAIVNSAQLSGAKHIMFNLQGVTFMDSTALGGLALAYLNLKESEFGDEPGRSAATHQIFTRRREFSYLDSHLSLRRKSLPIYPVVPKYSSTFFLRFGKIMRKYAILVSLYLFALANHEKL